MTIPNNIKSMPFGHIVGCVTAIVEDMVLDVPEGFASLVERNIIKLDYYLVNALKKEVNETSVETPETGRMILDSELMKLADEYYQIRNQFKSIPDINVSMSDGSFWTGYYQQKTRNCILAARKRIGEQIRYAREKVGMSLRDLAEKSGIAYNHISRIENGRYNVSIDTLTKIATVLGVELIMDKCAKNYNNLD